MELPLQIGDGRQSSASVSAHGGQVLSWVARGRERLFLSPNTSFDTGRAIRGGIPVIFPQFAGYGDGLRHGFARLRRWTPVPREVGPTDRISLTLHDDAQSLETWPHPFEAELEASLFPDRLGVTLKVKNTGNRAFEFTAALHTYLCVGDLAGAYIHGLEGRKYIDSANEGKPLVGGPGAVVLQGEVDRIYPGASGPLRLIDGGDSISLESDGFPDTVVWNPGAALAARLPDLGAGGHLRFVCIEAAAVAEPIRLAPAETWLGRQVLALDR